MNVSEDAWVSTTSLNFSRRDSAEMEDGKRFEAAKESGLRSGVPVRGRRLHAHLGLSKVALYLGGLCGRPIRDEALKRCARKSITSRCLQLAARLQQFESGPSTAHIF